MATSIQPSTVNTQPNTTLYVNNLNDKVKRDEIRSQLFALFTTYGKIIDIVSSKSQKMRGQAFLVFADLASATSAMRACEGMMFYDKPLHVTYAKRKSYAALRREDPSFVPPTSVNASTLAVQNGKPAEKKRPRDEEIADGERRTKREKSEEDVEEMEIDDDDDQTQQNGKHSAIPPPVQQPSARLLCTNLPQEVTDDVLSVLFQQYQGFQTTQVAPSPALNAAGAKMKMARVLFESSDLASAAKEALDGFTLKKGWSMSVVYI